MMRLGVQGVALTAAYLAGQQHLDAGRAGVAHVLEEYGGLHAQQVVVATVGEEGNRREDTRQGEALQCRRVTRRHCICQLQALQQHLREHSMNDCVPSPENPPPSSAMVVIDHLLP